MEADMDRGDSPSEQATDTDHYAHLLSVSDPIRQPIIQAGIQTLQPPKGSRGLDAGCGIGLQVLSLAEAVGPAGHVTGLDISPAFLARARVLARDAGLSDRVSFREGSIHDLPFEDNSFDWLWSADCAGYPAREPLALVAELARVVRPGGTVALLVYASQMLLAGYPLLEARLNATATGIAPFALDMEPESHHLCALGWFRQARLEDATAHTLVAEFHAPLSGEVRRGLTALLEMRWGGAEGEVSPSEWAVYRHLSQPDSPGFILDEPGYYGFFTESMFQGRVAR
jgi:ubiquinone/menaquinone biosynthesis C-methylase UbiE